MMLYAAESPSSGPESYAESYAESYPGPPGDGAQWSNAPRTSHSPIKEILVTLAAPYEQPTLETALSELAGQTAFDLAELRPSPDGLLGQWHARFRLRAPRGIVGDAQIYALLRCFAGDLRWVEISKELAHEIPAHLARQVGSS